MEYLLDYLEKSKFIQKRENSNEFQITVKGFEIYNASNLNSKTAFIAMWITSSTDNPKQHKIMETIYGCIKEAVTQSGYEPLRIDQKEHVNKIDDEILSEIKKARFIVCDLTSEKNKPRGSVYFEAGYALGKNIPIIWTCDNNLSQNLSFDIRQYNCLFWEKDKLEEFRKKLKHRIENIIGEGPLKPTDQTQQET